MSDLMTDALRMPAGPELDGRVAVCVFGWETRHVYGNDDQMAPVPPEYPFELVQLLAGDSIYKLVPHYSTDIALAWTVVEKITVMKHPSGMTWDPCVKVGMSDDGAFCEIFEKSIGYVGQKWILPSICIKSDSAPEAICRAALLALEPKHD